MGPSIMACSVMRLLSLPEVQVLGALTRDGCLLILARVVRLFGFGFLSVVFALYLAALGLTDGQIGLVLTLTLVGDAALSLWIATVADRLGRRRMLLLGAGLMVFGGVVFGVSSVVPLLALAAFIGTLSPSGGEVGPFLSIEQAALPQTTTDEHRTPVFAWYNLVGSFATALGALGGGALAQAMQDLGSTPLASYRVILLGYAGLGVLLGWFFTRLSPAVEVTQVVNRPVKRRLGLHRSRGVVFKLGTLFMLDSFGGGLVVQSLMAYWFHARFGVEPALLGTIFFGANLFAGLSALAAARIAARIGLINTMVVTHLPSNIFLMLVPFMPSLPLAIAMLLLRFSLSQMDVPTRQSYTMAVVDPDERSAAAGLTSVARTIASAWAPLLTGALFNASLWGAPFVLAGLLKSVYDLTLYGSFRAIKPPEERRETAAS
jgi:MFS family permease